MITIIGIILYLLMGVIGYVIVRKAYLLKFNSWTISDRNSHLFGILLSIFFVLFGVFLYIDALSDKMGDKPSKW